MIAFMLCLFSSTFVSADESLIAVHNSFDYSPGETLNVITSIEYSDSITALGFRATLPEGWSFLSVTGDYEPALKPQEGSNGTIEFVWINIPASPFTLTYTVSVPSNESGEKEISSEVVYRRLGGELIEPVTPDPLLLLEK